MLFVKNVHLLWDNLRQLWGTIITKIPNVYPVACAEYNGKLSTIV
jgi:hypothetical protein